MESSRAVPHQPPSGGWSEIDGIVARALELPPGERPDYVAAACSGRREIAAEVESLLRASLAAGEFLDCPTRVVPDTLDSPQPRAPERVGPYRLLEEIGHGGMSVVYRAERDDGQFRKQAAVKLLATGWISPDSLRRFIAERQILATLDHPNICRLLDGAVADGVPYLVMDFVNGEPLLDYCRRNALSERERLQLFREICAAVQYAHQHLIVHRDIKPGNILVTRERQVKLMDFGIAKVLETSGANDQTQAGFGAMTPDYASPEQIHGGPATTQTDVYSLGVLLYELLTGKRPYTAAGKSIVALLAIVNNAEPPAAGLAPELLAIARRAMAKDPIERYPSASALDDDVARYLSGQPVLAVPPSRWYLFRKWFGRHRVPVLAGITALMLILSATGFALWSAAVARRERALSERRFREVRQLADKVLFDYLFALRRITAATNLQLRMATDSLRYLDNLARAKSSDPDMLLDLARGYVQIGMLLGTPTTANLGQPERALEAYTKARNILEGLLRRNPDHVQARHELATVLRRLSQLDKANARQLAEQSLALWEQLYRRRHDTGDLFNLGWVHIRLAELDFQSDHARQAIAFFSAFLAARPNHVNATHQQAYAERLLARGLLARNDARRALAAAQTARTLDERARALVAADAYPMEISLDLQLIARSYAQLNQLAAARELFHQTANARRKVFATNQGDEWVGHQFLDSLCWLGWIAERQGDWHAARSTYREGVKLAPALKTVQPSDEWNTALGFLYGSEALLLNKDGFRRQGCALLVKSMRYFSAVRSFESPVLQNRGLEVQRAAAGCPN